WQGLGYYARARNMHRCAQTIVADHGGRFPDTEEALLRLPGIGAYTAAAVAAIAFGRPATVVDGNVERVVARLDAIGTPLPQAKPEIRAAAARLTPQHRPGDYAQAMMDLGATVCTPRAPRCMVCPLEDVCTARRQGIAAELPRRAARAVRPVRLGAAFWLRRPDGAVLLRRRAEKGLLGGMMEVPSTAWRLEPWDEAEAAAQAPLPLDAWRPLAGAVRHVFTHFELQLTVLAARVTADAAPPAAGLWVPVAHLGDHALPSLMKKVVRHALAAEGEGAAAP